MKKIEVLLEKRTADTKKKLNRSNKTIDVALLNKIDEGVTSEFLNSIGVPIFKYQTQITVHGQFPDIGNVYVAGYKHIFQNQNKSVGIRYNAIDYEKKKRIYSTLAKIGNWRVRENSSEYVAYKRSKMSSDKNVLLDSIKLLQSGINRIKTDLFSGGVNLYVYSYLGMFFAEAQLVVNAVNETNVLPLILNILNVEEDEMWRKLKEYDIAKKKEQDDIKAKNEEKRKNYDIEQQKKMDELEPSLNDMEKRLAKDGYKVFTGQYRHGDKVVVPYKDTRTVSVKLYCLNFFEKKGELYVNQIIVNEISDIKFAQNRVFEIKTRKASKLKKDLVVYNK